MNNRLSPMTSPFVVKECLHDSKSEKLRKALAEARERSTTALGVAFRQKSNSDLLENAQVTVQSAKRKLMMAMANSDRAELNRSASNPVYGNLKSDINTFMHLLDRNLRHLQNAQNFATQQTLTAVTRAAFLRAVQIVRQKQEAENNRKKVIVLNRKSTFEESKGHQRDNTKISVRDFLQVLAEAQDSDSEEEVDDFF